MTNKEAALQIALKQMQIATLMPKTWLDLNGEGSEYDIALRVAMKVLLEKPEEEVNV